MVDFHWNGKRSMLSLFIRKVINKLSKTIVQFHFYLFVGKYLNTCFMTPCLSTFSKSIWIQTGRCLHQLLSINHEIFSAFHMGLEVRGIFLDISKAFDKAWHDGLIFKLRQNCIWVEMINILEDFPSHRKQSF